MLVAQRIVVSAPVQFPLRIWFLDLTWTGLDRIGDLETRLGLDNNFTE